MDNSPITIKHFIKTRFDCQKERKEVLERKKKKERKVERKNWKERKKKRKKERKKNHITHVLTKMSIVRKEGERHYI